MPCTSKWECRTSSSQQAKGVRTSISRRFHSNSSLHPAFLSLVQADCDRQSEKGCSSKTRLSRQVYSIQVRQHLQSACLALKRPRCHKQGSTSATSGAGPVQTARLCRLQKELHALCSVLRHTHPCSAASMQSHSQDRGLNTANRPHGVTAQLYPSSPYRFESQQMLSSLCAA